MLKHTVFANNFKIMVDKKKEDIETELEYLYQTAVEKSKNDKKMFILIYYSGEGAVVYD